LLLQIFLLIYYFIGDFRYLYNLFCYILIFNLTIVFLQSLEFVRQDLIGYNIWASVDETQDAKGRYIANLVVGKLPERGPSTAYLVACKQLERTNNETGEICK
jgi:hypothetical protein